MSITVVDITSVPSVAGGSACSGTLRSSHAQELPALRLTPRGRWVVVMGVLALVFAALTLFGAPAVSTGQVRHVPARTVVVRPGQTLWDIARAVAPEQDPRHEIAKIVDLNSLSDAGAIRAGQPLDIPAAD